VQRVVEVGVGGKQIERRTTRPHEPEKGA